MKPSRTVIAGGVVALWIAGLAIMLHRNASRSETQHLAEVALRLQPATFYYIVDRDGKQIGAASSALDTTTQSLTSEEYFVGDFPSGSSTAHTSARWKTRLSRAFRLGEMSIDVNRPTWPFTLSATVRNDSTLSIAATNAAGGGAARQVAFKGPLFTPALAPVAFMLGGSHDIGRKQRMSIFDPTTRTVIRPELQIRAESLFTVVDSARLDTNGEWAAAHQDTVRAWRIEGAPGGLSAWVDAEGRIVAARAANGLSVMRTAFEIAFRNSPTR